MGERPIERDEVFRMKTARTPGTLARALGVAGEYGAHIGEIETVHIGAEYSVRDVSIIAPSQEAADQIAAAFERMEGVEVVHGRVDKVFQKHEGGKIKVHANTTVRTLQDMRDVYTPGVARVVQAIVEDEAVANNLTWRANTVAIVTNGTRVLGLGDVGPVAALPVMEGKALFYAEMVGVNAVPIVLDTKDPGEVIETVLRISPGFGAIHLEDIATPGVYHIERVLEERLDIPVFHDDQHGTAVVVSAAVVSAAKKVGRELRDMRFGQVGLGAAGSAIAGLASGLGFKEIWTYDPSESGIERLREVVSEGVAVKSGSDSGHFDSLVEHCDVLVLATGQPGLLSPEQVQKGQIIMALTNPVPEIDYTDALAAGAAVAADGSIVNNVLAYPGLIKGALDAGVSSVTPKMKQAAVFAIAQGAKDGFLLPEPLSKALHTSVAEAVALAAR